MRKVLNAALCATLFVSLPAMANDTGLGRILLTMGHVNPACRIVIHKEHATGIERSFRIGIGPGQSDIATVVLAALVSQSDVNIVFDPAQTSGCGNEAAIQYISISPGR